MWIVTNGMCFPLREFSGIQFEKRKPERPDGPTDRAQGCEVGVLLSLQKHRKNQSDPNGRGRKYGNEIPWQCSWQSSGELSGPSCLETPHFHCVVPSHCSELFARTCS